MTVFTCARCEAVLTEDLAELPLADLGQPVVPYELASGEDCPAWVPRGSFAVDPDPHGPPYVPSATEREMISAGPRNTVLISPEDLIVHALTPDLNRRNGCCGLDGRGGPNLVCTCGTEFATESSDCYTARVVHLEPYAVVRAE
jgi:hypothetical protein